MTSSRPPAAAKHSAHAALRRNDGECGATRPALMYVLAAILAVLAAQALLRERDASAAEVSRHRAHVVQRRAAGLRSEDAGAAAPITWYAPPTAGQLARPPPRPPSEEQAEAQEEEMGISPADWRLPPSPNPDPSARPAIDDLWPRNGPESGGQRVQIRGRNLQPVLVLFGRSPARILAVDESDGNVVLTLLAPPRTGPAQVAIVVTNSDGSSAIAQFEYYR